MLCMQSFTNKSPDTTYKRVKRGMWNGIRGTHFENMKSSVNLHHLVNAVQTITGLVMFAYWSVTAALHDQLRSLVVCRRNREQTHTVENSRWRPGWGTQTHLPTAATCLHKQTLWDSQATAWNVDMCLTKTSSPSPHSPLLTHFISRTRRHSFVEPCNMVIRLYT